MRLSLSRAIHDAVAVRAVNYGADDVRIDDGRLSIDPHTMRARFALRFGRDASDDQKVLQRSGVVRSAFNSPFWPFVLTSTSVGQEGPDFHQYCHAVVHWNLAANPVDLEQREGRVHRCKGYAIRKNVAERHRATVFALRAIDPWDAMFREAVRCSRGRRPRGLEPFWVCDGSARVERHVAVLPLSGADKALPATEAAWIDLASSRLVPVRVARCWGLRHSLKGSKTLQRARSLRAVDRSLQLIAGSAPFAPS
jgi:hypothetical protein